ncbi:MAG: PCC domain-containing protein, partial [Acidilobus sp.]
MPAFEIATFPTSVVVVRLEPNEEILEAITDMASKLGIRSGFVIAIGGLRRVELGVYKGGTYDTETYEAKEGETIKLTSAIG